MYTAAGNVMMMNPNRVEMNKSDYEECEMKIPGNPTRCLKDHCLENCGKCYEICSTGGSFLSDANQDEGTCIVIQLDDLCPTGYGNITHNGYCGQEMNGVTVPF